MAGDGNSVATRQTDAEEKLLRKRGVGAPRKLVTKKRHDQCHADWKADKLRNAFKDRTEGLYGVMTAERSRCRWLHVTEMLNADRNSTGLECFEAVESRIDLDVLSHGLCCRQPMEHLCEISFLDTFHARCRTWVYEIIVALCKFLLQGCPTEIYLKFLLQGCPTEI